jgi:hypothetical protein
MVARLLFRNRFVYDRHINAQEEPYEFQEFRQLIRDFLKDVRAMRGEL